MEGQEFERVKNFLNSNGYLSGKVMWLGY